MNKNIYVLFEQDYGGMFSSNDVPIGATFSEEKAKEWIEKGNGRSYQKVPIVE